MFDDQSPIPTPGEESVVGVGSRRTFVRRAAIAASGAAAGQLAVVLSSPLLTRWFSPDDFGRLGAFLGIASIASLVSTLRLDAAVPLPADDDEARRVVDVALLASSIMAAVAVVVLVLLWQTTSTLGDWSGIAALSVPTMIGMAAFNTVVVWCVRVDRFGTTALARVWLGLVTVAVQIGAGALGAGTMGLLIGPAIGWTSGALVLTLGARLGHRSSPLHVAELLRRYRRFPMFSTAAAVLNRGAQELATIGFLLVFGPTEAGWFYLCSRSLTVPANVLASGASQSFVHRAGPLARTDLPSFRRLTRSTSLTMGLATAPFALGGMVLVPALLPMVFGQQWDEAGRLAVVILPSIVALMACVPVGHALVLLERNDLDLIRDIARFCGVGLVFLAAALFHLSLLLTVGLLSAVMSIMYLLKPILTIVAVDRLIASGSSVGGGRSADHLTGSMP